MKRIALWLSMILIPFAAHATVTSQSLSVTYTCTGSTGPYSFSFPISTAASLQVTQNGTVLASTAYTVTPVNNNFTNGGSVTLNSACPYPQTLVILRVTPLTQTTVFTDNMPTPMASIGNAVDKLTEIEQEQNTMASPLFTPQNVNTVFAGPSSGGASVPGFRPLTVADLPAGTAGQGCTLGNLIQNGCTGGISGPTALNSLSGPYDLYPSALDTGNGTYATPWANSTDNNAGFQTQLNLLTTGGRLTPQAGIFTGSTPIAITQSSTNIEGVGASFSTGGDAFNPPGGGTGILWTANANVFQIGNTSAQYPVGGTSLAKMYLYGTTATPTANPQTGAAITYYQYADQSKIADMNFTNFGTGLNWCDSLSVYGHTDYAYFEHLSFIGDGYGIYKPTGCIVTYGLLHASTFSDNGYNGVSYTGNSADTPQLFNGNIFTRNCKSAGCLATSTPSEVMYNGSTEASFMGNTYGDAGVCEANTPGCGGSTTYGTASELWLKGGFNTVMGENFYRSNGPIAGAYAVVAGSSFAKIGQNNYSNFNTTGAGDISISGGVTDTQINDYQATVTDNSGIRTIQNGVSSNNGDPASTGNWYNHTIQPGTVIQDSASGHVWYYLNAVGNRTDIGSVSRTFTGAATVQGGATINGGASITGGDSIAAANSGNPFGNLTLTTNGTAGSTHYSYEEACAAGSGEMTSAVATITTGNATLSGTNSINVATSAYSPDCTTATIYRTATVGGYTKGIIGTVATGLTFIDTGIVGDGTTAPTASENTTGALIANVALILPAVTINTNPLCVQTNNIVTNIGCGIKGTLTMTTATSDAATVTGATASSTCTFSPTNATAAAATVLAYVSSVTTNSVTISHAATVANGGTLNIVCSP